MEWNDRYIVDVCRDVCNVCEGHDVCNVCEERDMWNLYHAPLKIKIASIKFYLNAGYQESM